MKRFKHRTMGHCLLMGRKTFDSIGRLLPGRQTIVLTRNPHLAVPAGVVLAADLLQVPSLVDPGRRVMVVGGAEVYRAALAYCNQLWITRVMAELAGDTYFPDIDWGCWRLLETVHNEPGPDDDWPTEFQIWERRCPQ